MSRPSPAEHGRVAAEKYAVPAYQSFLEELRAVAESVANAAVRNARVPEHHVVVTSRCKDPESFRRKASKAQVHDESLPKYLHPCLDITDQVAVRVMTLLPAQAEAVADAFEEVEGALVRERNARPVEQGKFGYASFHRLVEVDGYDGCPAPLPGYAVPQIEVQVRTQLQHVWAELEHDVRYKGSADPEVSRRFDRVAALVELADSLLQEAVNLSDAGDDPAPTSEASDTAVPAATAAPLSLSELRQVLAEFFPEARESQPGPQEWICAHARGIGLDTAGKLRGALEALRLDAIREAFVELGYGDRPQVRCLDDALLAHAQDRYVEAVMATFPEPTKGTRASRARKLRWRLEQLREHGAV